MEPRTKLRPRTGRRIFYGWVIVAVAFAAVFSEATTRAFLLSVFVVPVSQEFGWSRTAFSGAIAAGSVLGSLLAPAVGPVIDNRGPKAVIVIGVVVTSTAFMALAFIQHLWQFYALLVVARAVSNSTVMMASMVCVANWFVRRRGRAIAISRSGTWVAIPLFILLIQIIIAASSWRVAWFVMGALTMVVAIPPTLLFIKRRPEDVGLLPDGDTPDGPDSTATSAGRARPVIEANWSVREATRTRALWLIILATGLGGMVAQAVNLHALASFTDRGLSTTSAAGVVGFTLIVSGAGTLTWGLIVERMHVRYATALIYLCNAAGVAIIVFADTLPMAYAYALVYGFGFGGLRIMEHIVYADYFGRRHLGAISGFSKPFHLFTNAGGPLIASLAYDLRGSYAVAFAMFAVAHLLAAVLMLAAAPPKKEAVPHPE
jgi:MFS family permease